MKSAGSRGPAAGNVCRLGGRGRCHRPAGTTGGEALRPKNFWLLERDGQLELHRAGPNQEVLTITTREACWLLATLAARLMQPRRRRRRATRGRR